MKNFYSILVAGIVLFSCQPAQDNSANEAFERNSQTVLASLEAWQNEDFDYSIYAEDFIARGTGFGDKDTLTLEEVKEGNSRIWAAYDFKLADPVVLLPGVNADTKLADGSVRYYGDWTVTRPATDSTEEKSGVIKIYSSYDFDEEGKIIFEQTYGDFTGIMTYLNSDE